MSHRPAFAMPRRLPTLIALILVTLTVLGAVALGHRHDTDPQDLAALKRGTARLPTTAMPKGPQLSKPESGIISSATIERDLATGRILRVRGRIPSPGARTAAEAAERFLK